MRLGYVMAIATLLAGPTMADELIIGGPDHRPAAEARHNAKQAARDERQDLNAARRDEKQEQRDIAHGNPGGAAEAEQSEQRHLNDATRDSQGARPDIDRPGPDAGVTIRIKP
jgi:hypothetical protein